MTGGEVSLFPQRPGGGIVMSTPGLLDAVMGKTLQPRPDCVIWNGAVDRGYGRIYVDGTAKRVHRVVWELKHGPIPDGMTIDHLCRIRSCLNTEHMEVVTGEENTRRRPKIKRASLVPRALKRACRHGHEFTPENTLVDSSGYRRCRTCRDARNRSRSAPKPGVAA